MDDEPVVEADDEHELVVDEHDEGNVSLCSFVIILSCFYFCFCFFFFLLFILLLLQLLFNIFNLKKFEI
jgi:hypothetical protein